MTLRTLRVGVVGTGALGFHHARLLRRMDGVEFVGIYDVNPVRAAEVARELETVAHPSFDALVDRVDAVSIAVPTSVHTEVGLAVLGRGIPALIEKPLADSLEGADRLVAEAVRTNASTGRYVPPRRISTRRVFSRPSGWPRSSHAVPTSP